MSAIMRQEVHHDEEEISATEATVLSSSVVKQFVLFLLGCVLWTGQPVDKTFHSQDEDN